MSEIREQARWLSKELNASKAAIKALSKPQLGNSSIEAGKVEEYDAEGTLVSVVGEQFDGTHAAVTVAGPPPPEPMPPTVTTGINSAEVRWSGRFVDEALSPMDFSHVTVHASRLESFDPDNTTQRATITGESGDVATLALDSGEWYFLLVAVSKAGKWSSPSDAVLAEVQDFLQDVVTDALIDLDTKYDGVIYDAGQLDERLGTAEGDLTASKGRLDAAEGQLTDAFGQLNTVDTRIGTAKTQALAAAATDAQSKADSARAVAVAAQTAADAAVSQAVNAVPDPGFENGGAGWIPDNTGVTFPTVPDGHGGSKVLQIVAPTGATTVGPNANLFAPVTPGDVWQVSAWVRVVGTLPTTGDLRLAPITQTATGTKAYPGVVTLAAADMTTSWQRVVGTYTIPAGVVGLCFRIRGDGALNGGTVIQVDDVDMRDITAAKAALDAAATAKGIADAAAAAAATAQGAAGAAQGTADAALNMAGSKTKSYYSTAVATGTGTTVGDVWRQRNASNEIIAEWQWSGSGWVKQTVSGSNVSNMDIGYLTAGAATMSQALIDKLVANTANFQRADIKNLFATSGTLDTAVINKLWTDVVNSKKITSQMIAVGDFTNLIPDVGFLSPEVTALRNAQFTNGGTVAVNAAGDLALTLTSTGSSYFRPTGINQTAAAYKDWIPVQPGDKFLLAANITLPAGGTGDIRLSGRTKDGQATVTITGAPTLISGDNTYMATIPANCYWMLPEIRFSGAAGTAVIAANSLMLRRRLKGQLIVEGEVTADKLASKIILTSEIIAGNPDGTQAKMTPTGFKVLAAGADGAAPSEVIRMGTDTDDYFGVTKANGELVASISSSGAMTATGLDVDAYDPLTNTGGLSIDGTQLEESLWSMPKGIIARAGRSLNSLYWAGTTPQPYLQLDFDAAAGRMYQVTSTPIGLDSDTANAEGVVNLHYRTGGLAAETSSTVIAYGQSVQGSSSTRRSPVTLSRPITPPAGPVSLLVSYGTVSTGRSKIIVSGGRDVLLTVEDMGAAPVDVGISRDGTGDAATAGTGGGTGIAAPKNYDRTFTADGGIQSYKGSSFGSGKYNYAPAYMYSGPSPTAGNGDLSSIAVFPDIKSVINGGTVTGVWVYVYYDFWWYGSGGDAYIGFHGQLGIPDTMPAKTYQHATSLAWPRAAGRWIKMSSSTYAGWASGLHRGITLGGSGGGLERYGYAHNPKIRVTWTK